MTKFNNDNALMYPRKTRVSHYSWKLLIIFLFASSVIGMGSLVPAFADTRSPISANQNPVTAVALSYQAMDGAMNAGAATHSAHVALADSQFLFSITQAAVSGSASGAFLYRYDLYRISAFQAWATRHAYDFSAIHVWSTFQPTSTAIHGAQAVVRGTETLHIDATVQDNRQPHRFSQAKEAVQDLIKQTGRFIAFGQTNHAEAIISHTATLSLTGSGWTIESDTYWDPLVQALAPDHRSLEAHMQPAMGQYTSSKHQNSLLNSATYNRQGAINYAETWWNSCNPNYTCYMSQGVDCANFVSQSLYDGSGGNLPGDNTWYAGSYAFVNADGLYHYMANNYAAATYSSYSYSTAAYDDDWYEYPGDLIFYDWGNVFGFGNADGVIDHTAISVAQDANGYTYEDAHTTNLYHYYWDLGGGTQTGYYFVIMNG